MANVPVTMTVSARGVNTTEQALGKVTASVDRMRKMQARAVAVGNVMATVAMRGARQVKAFASEALTSADGIAKSARSMGLSNRAYQQMAFAAERSGIEVRALDTALRTMQTRMVNSSTIANKLGVSFDHLRGMAPEDQFREIGKMLNALDDPAERVALSAELFGRQGPRIAAMAGDFEALSAEAERLGVIMDDGALRTAEQFNDQMTNIRKRMQAVFVNMLPDVMLFGRAMGAGLRWAYDVAVAVTTGMLGLFSLENWKPIWHNLAEGLGAAFYNTFENLKKLIEAARRWIRGGGWSFEAQGTFEGAQFQTVPLIRDFMGDLEKASERYNDSLDRAAQARVEADEYVSESATGVADALGAVSSAPDRTRGLEAATFGSVEAARAIARMRDGSGNVEQRQLSALEQIERNTATGIGGGLDITEYAIA